MLTATQLDARNTLARETVPAFGWQCFPAVKLRVVVSAKSFVDQALFGMRRIYIEKSVILSEMNQFKYFFDLYVCSVIRTHCFLGAICTDFLA